MQLSQGQDRQPLSPEGASPQCVCGSGVLLVDTVQQQIIRCTSRYVKKIIVTFYSINSMDISVKAVL